MIRDNAPDHDETGPSMRDTIAEAGRLLRHLYDPGHTAVIGSLAPDRVILSSTRNGVSLGRGTVAVSAADLLLQRGLVREASRGAFAVTDAGRAMAGRFADNLEERAVDVVPVAPMPSRKGRPANPRRTAKAKAAPVERAVAPPGRIIGEATLQHEGEAVTVQVNEAESPLAWLHRRRDRTGVPFIDATCFEAGERLRRDMTMARIMPRITSRWSPSTGGGSGPAAATDAMVSARQRLDRALDAVDGDYAGILLDVCGFLKRIEDVERERHWPPRSGKVVLKLALQRLATHYGIAREARGPDKAGHIRSWLAG